MKLAVYFGGSVGGLIGGYVPVLFGTNPFDIASLLGGFIGALIGLWAGYKIGKNYDL